MIRRAGVQWNFGDPKGSLRLEFPVHFRPFSNSPVVLTIMGTSTTKVCVSSHSPSPRMAPTHRFAHCPLSTSTREDVSVSTRFLSAQSSQGPRWLPLQPPSPREKKWMRSRSIHPNPVSCFSYHSGLAQMLGHWPLSTLG